MRTLAWPMDRSEVHSVMESLRRRHFKWDIYHNGEPGILPDSLVLSAGDHQLLVESAEATWQALRTVEAVVRQSTERLEAVGVPANLHAAIARESLASPRVTRCDFHLTTDGEWRISEFNDDAPGGIGEASGLEAVISQDWADRFPSVGFLGDIKASIVQAFRPWERVGLVHATAYSADLQQTALIAAWLREAGHAAIIGSPANLLCEAGQASVMGEPVDALFRYYPGEWIGDLPNADDWTQASGFLPMMNPLSAVISQSKRFYAVSNEHPELFSNELRHALSAHMPASIYLTPQRRDEVILDRQRWVLKHAFGRMGHNLFVGARMTPSDWTTVIDRALTEPQLFALQERFDPAPLWFSAGAMYATVGVFLVDGRFAGYGSRVNAHPIINQGSCHVPTMVEVS